MTCYNCTFRELQAAHSPMPRNSNNSTTKSMSKLRSRWKICKNFVLHDNKVPSPQHPNMSTNHSSRARMKTPNKRQSQCGQEVQAHEQEEATEMAKVEDQWGETPKLWPLIGPPTLSRNSTAPTSGTTASTSTLPSWSPLRKPNRLLQAKV